MVSVVNAAARDQFYKRFVAQIHYPDLTLAGFLRDWDDMESVTRYCEVGEGALECAANGHNDGLLREGNLMVIRDRDRVLSFGPIEFGRERRGNSISRQVDWTDGTTYLNERRAYIDPAVKPAGRLSREFDERSGPTTSVIMGYVNDNLGPGARLDRRVPGLSMGPDPRNGIVLRSPVQARNELLLPLLQPLAMTGGVSFWVEIINGSMVFRCEPVRNRSADVRFSTLLNNVGDFKEQITAPEATVMLGADNGKGLEQAFVEMQSPESAADEALWRRRVEGLTTSRADGESLEAATLRALEATRTVVKAEFTPTDSALQPGRDYSIGDLVSWVVRPGVVVVKPFRELRHKVSVSGGIEIIPTIGDHKLAGADSFTDRALIRVVDSLNLR